MTREPGGEARVVPQLCFAREWRGGQRQALLLAEGLARRGVVAPVVVPPDSPVWQRAVERGLEVVPLPLLGEMDPLGAARLARLSRRLGADALHAHDATAHGTAALARLFGRRAPLVVSRRSLSDRTDAVTRLKYRHGAEAYVAVSGATREALLALGIAAERVRVVPDAVAPEPDAPERAVDWRTRLALPGDAFVVGWAGALTGEKDPATGVRTLASLAPAAHLVVMGQGPQESALRELGARLGVAERLHVVGWVEAIGPALRGLDAYLQTSRSEGLGSAVLEAMARGVPVVSSAAGGLRELVRDGETGLLAQPGDAAALAAALERLRGSEPLRRRLCAAGLEQARRHTVESMVAGTQAAYAAALAAAGRR